MTPVSRCTGTLFFSADFTITGAVKAPWFKLGRDSQEHWRETLRHEPAPWADLEGDHAVLTLPSIRIRDLDDPTPIIRFYDQKKTVRADSDGRELPPGCAALQRRKTAQPGRLLSRFSNAIHFRRNPSYIRHSLQNLLTQRTLQRSFFYKNSNKNKKLCNASLQADDWLHPSGCKGKPGISVQAFPV